MIKENPWESRFLILAIVFIVVGIGTMFVPLLVAKVELQVGFLGTAAGITSIGVGFLGAWIAQKSDTKMKAIANSEFDEKGAMIQKYEAYFNSNFDEAEFNRFRWDLEAMAHVAKWADKDKRLKISQSADKIVMAVNGKATDGDLERIRSLSLQIRG